MPPTTTTAASATEAPPPKNTATATAWPRRAKPLASTTNWRSAPPRSSERVRKRMSLGSGCTGEDKLIATQPTAASHHIPEHKPPVPIKPKNLLGLGHFEWITADPINHIAPGRHAAHTMLCIMSPSVKRLAA